MSGKWGAINSGALYHVLTVDLDRALAHAGLNRYEAMLMQYVREQSWGVVARFKGKGAKWPDPVPCVLHIRDLAKEWGVPRQRLQEAKRNLVERKILTENNCAALVNKAVDKWKGMTPESIAFAHKATCITGTPERSDVERPSVPPRNAVACPPGTPQRAPRNATACQKERASVPPSHYIERTRDSEERDTEEGGERETREANGFDDDPSKPVEWRVALMLGAEHEEPGVPDRFARSTIKQMLRGASPEAAMQAASIARANADPSAWLTYFYGMCRKGLSRFEPQAQTAAPAVPYAPAPARMTAGDRREALCDHILANIEGWVKSD
jgi:hypothetical protein